MEVKEKRKMDDLPNLQKQPKQPKQQIRKIPGGGISIYRMEIKYDSNKARIMVVFKSNLYEERGDLIRRLLYDLGGKERQSLIMICKIRRDSNI